MGISHFSLNSCFFCVYAPSVIHLRKISASGHFPAVGYDAPEKQSILRQVIADFQLFTLGKRHDKRRHHFTIPHLLGRLSLFVWNFFSYRTA